MAPHTVRGQRCWPGRGRSHRISCAHGCYLQGEAPLHAAVLPTDGTRSLAGVWQALLFAPYCSAPLTCFISLTPAQLLSQRGQLLLATSMMHLTDAGQCLPMAWQQWYVLTPSPNGPAFLLKHLACREQLALPLVGPCSMWMCPLWLLACHKSDMISSTLAL